MARVQPARPSPAHHRGCSEAAPLGSGQPPQRRLPARAPLPLTIPSWVALTTDRSAATGLPGGLARLEPGLLPAHHVQTRNGLRLTSVARTVIDCMRELPLPDAVAIADAALRRGLIVEAELSAVRQEQRGWPFITTAGAFSAGSTDSGGRTRLWPRLTGGASTSASSTLAEPALKPPRSLSSPRRSARTGCVTAALSSSDGI